mmetsp:Transcript_20278/g.38146  ORF Transcript_20278/g.38146 Transcript_20278/m.38146 type:complete len:98 (-) Transcript_20278:485-778(-)
MLMRTLADDCLLLQVRMGLLHLRMGLVPLSDVIGEWNKHERVVWGLFVANENPRTLVAYENTPTEKGCFCVVSRTSPNVAHAQQLTRNTRDSFSKTN